MESCWCYETEFEFRSLMAWGKKLLLSLSVFAIMLRKRLPDGSKRKKRLPGRFESLMILAALFLQRLRKMSCREGRADPEMQDPETCGFLLHKMLIDGLEWCVLLWCFYQLFGLSFWRHPFTAEDPLVSKWCNATFLQTCSDEQTNLDGLRGHFLLIFIFMFLNLKITILTAVQLK